ncbi:MAG: hypothetical protein H0T46_05960 [Deltaproteobacteria bacterium]|nr:hypothetical protein [Deltaproteobacteria bacterium]
MSTTFSLGLGALLSNPDDEKPGGYCRDELLFSLLDYGKVQKPYYELREVLSADLPMASGSEGEVGELVVVARPGVGGPLRPEIAEHLLRKWTRAPKSATVAAQPSKFDLADRSILVPEFFPAIEVPKTSPLGPATVSCPRVVRDAVRALAHQGDESAEVIAMLTLCAVHGFVVCAVRS